MGISKISIALICYMLGLVLVHTIHAQNSQQEYLNAHNSARSAVGVGRLVWDAKVETFAQNYANQRKGDCSLVHSGGPYGKNFAWSSADLSGTDAMMWVNEKADYDYNSNTCAAGKQCGHYALVVWQNSIRVGCAKVKCDNGGGTFIGCNYDPPGNFPGQRPY